MDIYTKVWSESLNVGDQAEDIGVDEKITLERFLKK
jgi:hypothetical protein